METTRGVNEACPLILFFGHIHTSSSAHAFCSRTRVECVYLMGRVG